jgi:type IV secretory pathway VirB2 component (pilin)
MLEKNLIEKRFIATLVAIIATSLLVYTGKLGAANYEQIIIWVVGVFVAGGASDVWAAYSSLARSKATALASSASAPKQLNG